MVFPHNPHDHHALSIHCFISIIHVLDNYPHPHVSALHKKSSIIYHIIFVCIDIRDQLVQIASSINRINSSSSSSLSSLEVQSLFKPYPNPVSLYSYATQIKQIYILRGCYPLSLSVMSLIYPHDLKQIVDNMNVNDQRCIAYSCEHFVIKVRHNVPRRKSGGQNVEKEPQNVFVLGTNIGCHRGK